MTARSSASQGDTGGHRPPLQLELQTHLERALSWRLERASADVVDEPESACEETIRRVRGSGCSATGAGGVLHLQAVEDVLEVHPQRERWPSFAELEHA